MLLQIVFVVVFVGWREHLLNEMGRTTIVTFVLAFASVCLMSSLLLFKGTVDSLVQKQALSTPLFKNSVLSFGREKTSAEGVNVKLYGMMLPSPLVCQIWLRRIRAS